MKAFLFPCTKKAICLVCKTGQTISQINIKISGCSKGWHYFVDDLLSGIQLKIGIKTSMTQDEYFLNNSFKSFAAHTRVFKVS
jgi:hypothetical protein